MTTTPPPDDFREQLSAWHDGALPDEAARFVLKRLLQDDALRAEVGRWQAVGDALRRQGQALPRVDVPGRVQARIAREAAVGVIASGPRAPQRAAHRPSRRGALWAGAAAIGLGALLLRPFDDAAAPATLADRPAAPVAPAARPAAAFVDLHAGLPARERSVAPRMIPPDGATRSAMEVPPLVRAPQPTPEQLAPLPAVEAPSRPWPRSASAPAAFTVDYSVHGSARDR